MTTRLSTHARRALRFRPGVLLIYLLLGTWAVTTIFPFVWVINNSFKASSLVVSDSFAPAFRTVYSRDQFGQIIRKRVQKDEYGRDMYREYLKDETGAPLRERDAVRPTLNQQSAFAGLMGYNATPELNEATADLPAYDTRPLAVS